jgi:hypothetical protein
VKCLDAGCAESIGFALKGVEFRFVSDNGSSSPYVEQVATHRVVKSKCRGCGCEIQFFHRVE